jgi:UDP-N-acetylmuramoyl-L-alanyl-D-glutamate--2,6-diaminopimelate ligase
MTLEDILYDIPLEEKHGDFSKEIRALRYRSCDVEPGDLFFAWKGEKADGHDYVDDALKRGAIALLLEKKCSVPEEITWARASSGRRALALASATFFKQPGRHLQMAGVTGTNGKTSTATLLHYLLERAGVKTGLLGTVEYRIGGERIEAARTTPESHDLQKMLAQMLQKQCRAAVMEVSSHALALERVAGIPFRISVFTNLTQDHLDFHGTMESYFLAKAKLFTGLTPGATAVVNIDDPYGTRLLSLIAKGVEVKTYSLNGEADFTARELQCTDKGIFFECVNEGKSFPVGIPWLGKFNAGNVLGVIAAASSLGLTNQQLTSWLAEAPFVPGRMQRIGGSGDFQVLVDYAHTDDAVRNLLESLRPLTQARLRILLGCGGDRDRAKRPVMARVACALADDVVFTSDNPRSENPESILEQMSAGVKDFLHYQIIKDREKAIESIINSALPGDIVVLAGKGHENTQEIAGVKTHFSDVEMASLYLEKLKVKQP